MLFHVGSDPSNADPSNADPSNAVMTPVIYLKMKRKQ